MLCLKLRNSLIEEMQGINLDGRGSFLPLRVSETPFKELVLPLFNIKFIAIKWNYYILSSVFMIIYSFYFQSNVKTSIQSLDN
jgi:hypothetical protein